MKRPHGAPGESKNKLHDTASALSIEQRWYKRASCQRQHVFRPAGSPFAGDQSQQQAGGAVGASVLSCSEWPRARHRLACCTRNKLTDLWVLVYTTRMASWWRHIKKCAFTLSFWSATELTSFIFPAAAKQFWPSLPNKIYAKSCDTETGQERTTNATQDTSLVESKDAPASLHQSKDAPASLSLVPHSAPTSRATGRHISAYYACIALEFTILAMLGFAAGVGALVNASNLSVCVYLCVCFYACWCVCCMRVHKHSAACSFVPVKQVLLYQ